MAAAPVLIAGAGIGGLALALALARRGIESRILERRKILSDAGAGIQLSPNAMRVLAGLGVDHLLEPTAGKPDAINVVDGASGRRIARLPLGAWIAARHGAPYWVAHRADLQSALLSAVGNAHGVDLVTGFNVTGFAETQNGVEVTAADGSTVEGAALVGADGLWSVVRAQVFPDAAPVFAGRLAARTVLPASVARGVLAEPATGMWLAPGVHVVHYPVRAGREIAVVVIAAEKIPKTGWSNPLDAGQLDQKLAPFAGELLDILGHAEEWRAWSLYDAVPLPSWSRGRVALLGDAVHPVLPFLAQGGAMALEGAATLGGLLAESSGEPAVAFQRYESARRGRVARVLAAARRNGAAYRLSGLAARARDRLLAVLPATRVMAAYDWIYGWRGDDPD